MTTEAKYVLGGVAFLAAVLAVAWYQASTRTRGETNIVYGFQVYDSSMVFQQGERAPVTHWDWDWIDGQMPIDKQWRNRTWNVRNTPLETRTRNDYTLVEEYYE